MTAKKNESKPKKSRAKSKAGKQPLVVGEKTLKETVRLPEKLHARMLRKINAQRSPNISLYLRRLVERDLQAS